jgi:hypothetical protein
VIIARLVAAFPDGERRRLLALDGAYPIGAPDDAIAARLIARIHAAPDRLVIALSAQPAVLTCAFHAIASGPFPGRAEALRKVAHALGRRGPAGEYALPEDTLESLLERAKAARGRRVPTQGAERHKGRVGDGVERLLTGAKVLGMASDHPAAEIKSVPVRGDQVIERVKLGVVSARSNPVDKCARVLFVFVEQRGDDHFVRGHALREFEPTQWQAMWRDGYLVETAAGSPRFPARGLYLTPRWFRASGIWPGA